MSRSSTEINQLSNQGNQKLVMELLVQQKDLKQQNEELKKSYEELQVSRKHFSKFYDTGSVAYVSINEDGTIQNANRAIGDLLDLPLSSITNKRLTDFIHSDDLDEFLLFMHDYESQNKNAVLSIRLNRSKEFQVASQCPGFRIINCAKSSCIQNNWMIHVECRRVVNYQDSDENHIFLTLTDCSETKLALESSRCLNSKLEDRLVKKTHELIGNNIILQQKVEELSLSRHQIVEKEAMLNAIFNAAVEGIFTIDNSGIIYSANSAIQTIFGYSPDELIGLSINMLIPDTKRKKHDTYLQFKSASVIDRIRNVDGLRKDGTLVPLDISITEFSLDDVHYYASVVRDVSSRKRKEQEDKDHLNELAHVTRLGLMGEMASGIAHEVNQPLTAIAGYTQACLNFVDAEALDLPQLRETLQKACHQALRAGQIIHRMREFVTFKTIRRTSVDINALINFCVEMAEGDFKHNEVTLKCYLDKAIPLIHVDQVQIEQVLLNLIRNSIEAVSLLPEHSKRLITVQTSMNECHRILVRVKDNGPGIEKSEQEKILTPFFTSKANGMGMGLSISQSIIRAHDGELYFNSAYGKGSSFYFTLPIQEA